MLSFFHVVGVAFSKCENWICFSTFETKFFILNFTTAFWTIDFCFSFFSNFFKDEKTPRGNFHYKNNSTTPTS